MRFLTSLASWDAVVVTALLFFALASFLAHAQSGGTWTTQGALSADCMMASRFVGWLERSYTVKLHLEPNGTVSVGKEELKRIVPVLKLALKTCEEKKRERR